MRHAAHARRTGNAADQQKKAPSRMGAAVHLGLGLAALISVASIAGITATRTIREINGLPTSLPTSPMPVFNEGPTPQQVELELLRIGIDPATLACAGAAEGDVTALVTDAQTYLATGYEDIRQAQLDYEQAKFARDELQRIVRSGTATQQQVDALAAAETALAARTSTRDARRGSLFEAAAADLQDELAAINTIKGHGRWKYPTWYKVVTRQHADSIALRDALANLRINPEYGLEVDPAAQTLVEDELEKPAVANAKAAYDARYTDINAAWKTALGL